MHSIVIMTLPTSHGWLCYELAVAESLCRVAVQSRCAGAPTPSLYAATSRYYIDMSKLTVPTRLTLSPVNSSCGSIPLHLNLLAAPNGYLAGAWSHNIS